MKLMEKWLDLTYQFIVRLKLSSVLELALSHSGAKREFPSHKNLIQKMKTGGDTIQNLLEVTSDTEWQTIG